jgi:hypothetical protein
MIGYDLIWEEHIAYKDGLYLFLSKTEVVFVITSLNSDKNSCKVFLFDKSSVSSLNFNIFQ